MRTVAIIAGGGLGKRIKGDLPKQFLMLRDRPILAHTVGKFEACDLVEEIILVVPEDYMGHCSQTIVDKFDFKKVKKLVCGGKERQDSVYTGLEACPAGTSVVVIHDAVRPLVSVEKISESIRLCQKKKAVVLAVSPKDTVKRGEDGSIITTLDRNKLWLVQTPQVFAYGLIMDAYQKAGEDEFIGTDDSILVERLGHEVAIVQGEYENIKITTAEDLAIAEMLLGRKSK